MLVKSENLIHFSYFPPIQNPPLFSQLLSSTQYLERDGIQVTYVRSARGEFMRVRKVPPRTFYSRPTQY